MKQKGSYLYGDKSESSPLRNNYRDFTWIIICFYFDNSQFNTSQNNDTYICYNNVKYCVIGSFE